ncbi:secondary thiamine-phosphate synthase enzyme YjbQ [Aestuariivirga sp.]|uniref:secondary thiamine-phosphate synthase enzyme YjbQ n=1 Tax=Aestuariivirga sp. TaxID=2650926 RepID=UPI0039E5F5B4
MRQHISELHIATRGQGLYDITGEVKKAARASGLSQGLVTVFCRHTSCSLIINENADPDVRHDLEHFLRRLVPENDPAYVHTIEGPDDMPAHIKTALTSTSLGIPLMGGALALGTWQAVYLFEHRSAPHSRHIIVQAMGE